MTRTPIVRARTRIVALAGIGALAVPLLPAAPAAPSEFAPASLPGVPDGAREPQVAVGRNGNVYLAYGVGDVVYCSASRDGGKTFGPPMPVAAAGRLSLGMRRGPRVVVAGTSVVITAVYGRGGKGADGDLLAWRSSDGGRTWKGPATVDDVPGAAREGLHAMAAAPDGTLTCVWLDLREPGTRIYSSLSRDGGTTWEKNVLAYRSPDGHVCECCHPSAAFGRDGTLYVMFRNWLGGSRDLYLVRSRDSGKTFDPASKLGSGTWPLDACPMDGGALTVSSAGAVETVWRRQDYLYTCTPGEPERQIGRGQQGWTAASPGGPCDVWIRGRPGLLFALFPGSASPLQLATGADDPVVASAPGGAGPFIVAWTAASSGASTIRAAVLAPQ